MESRSGNRKDWKAENTEQHTHERDTHTEKRDSRGKGEHLGEKEKGGTKRQTQALAGRLFATKLVLAGSHRGWADWRDDSESTKFQD